MGRCVRWVGVLGACLAALVAGCARPKPRAPRPPEPGRPAVEQPQEKPERPPLDEGELPLPEVPPRPPPGKVRMAVQTGHGYGGVGASAVNWNSGLIATGAPDDERVVIWDIATGRELRTVRSTGGTSHLEFSKDGRTLVVVGEDGSLTTWDHAAGVPVRRLQTHAGTEVVAASPDGRLLAEAQEGLVKVRDLATGKLVWSRKVESRGWGHPCFDGQGRLAVGTMEGRVLLFDAATGAENQVIDAAATNGIWALAASPDGRFLAATGFNRERIWLWTSKGKGPFEVRTLSAPNNGKYNSVLAFYPDGALLASDGFGDGQYQTVLWNPSTGERVRTIDLNTDWLCFSPDGRLLASRPGGATAISILDVATGKTVRELRARSHPTGHLEFSPDGNLLIAGNRIWDLAAAKLVRSPIDPARTPSEYPEYLTFGQDGKLIAGGGLVYDARTGKPLADLGPKARLHFSPRVSTVAIGESNRIQLYDESWTRIALLENEGPTALGTQWEDEVDSHYGVLTYYFSPDHRTAAFCGGRNVDIVELASGRRRTIETGLDATFVYAPDGRRALIWRGYPDVRDRVRDLVVWDLDSWRLVCQVAQLEPGYTAWIADGKQIAVCGKEKLRTYDPDSGKEIRAVPLQGEGHTVPIAYRAFSPDGTRLATSASDGKVILWDVASGKEIASLIRIDEDDYVIATPEYYYTASRDALSGVSFQTGEHVYPVDQFDLRLNRPDIVLERLGRAPPGLVDVYRAAYRKRLRKMGFTEEMLSESFKLPSIEVVSKGLPVSTAERQLKFRIRASDPERTLDRIQVYVNEVAVFGTQGIPVAERKARELEQEIAIELAVGRNEVQVSVVNAAGVESLRDTFDVSYTGPVEKPDLVVLAIGVSDYPGEKFDLTYAAKDARDIAAFLEGRRERFRELRKLELTDGAATRERILAAREHLVRSRVDDTVVVFAAGHGLLDEKLDYYFATADIDFAHPAARGLAYEALEGLLDGIPARKKVLLIDTCNSGEVDEDAAAQVALAPPAAGGKVKSRGFAAGHAESLARKEKKKVGLDRSIELARELFADIRRSSGAVVISSASGLEFAFESDRWRNGVFTYALLEKLRSAGPGPVMVSELRRHVSEAVRELTGGGQTPVARHESLAFDFPLY